MDIITNTTAKESSVDEKIRQLAPEHKTWRTRLTRFQATGIDVLLLVALAIAAFIPRIMLATQLDMVTDEGTYIKAGKTYLPLLRHFNITSGGWTFNYEHPPFVKLLIGLCIALNAHVGHPLSELLAARIPSIIAGTLLVVAIYWLARIPFGRVVALLAALCLAFSPWLVYFSALAYLDMTMTTLITVAYLLLWPALRQPRLYLLVAALVGLAVASKYTAALAIPGIILFTVYYYFIVRFKLPPDQRPAIPWRWWIAALVLAPIVFFLMDAAIWRNPLSLLLHSFLFEWHHSVDGHLTFLAGHYSGHVPHWAIFYIVFAKLSIFVTIPAVFFIVYALVQLVRFHLSRSTIPVSQAASTAFLFVWVISILGMFSLLNIVVGTHYLLPAAPPVALAGSCGLAILLRYRRGALFASDKPGVQETQETAAGAGLATPTHSRLNPRAALLVIVMTALLVISHLIGVTTVYGAEGYTSEVFHGENNVLQVAYPAYREAALWLLAHTHGTGKVGLVALPGTLEPGYSTEGWYVYNTDLQGRLKYIEVHPDAASFPVDYLVWPMHLVQRGYTIPSFWRSHIVHIIMGGSTIYCYIMARDGMHV